MSRYQIRVRGGTARDWKDWFRELEVQSAGEGSKGHAELIFTGPLPDQSALLGILMQMHNLNLMIQSVQILDDDERRK